jgi:hypothetical protein
MHNDFVSAAKEIFNLSDRAIIPFLNANFSASHPPDARVIRINTKHRFPLEKIYSQGKTIIADEVFLINDIDDSFRYHIEIQLDRRANMDIRRFLYDATEVLEHATKENGVWTSIFPRDLVIYLEPSSGIPDVEIVRVHFADDFCYDLRTQVIKLTELSVEELVKRHLVLFAPLYILKLRKKLKRAKTSEERKRLAVEMKKIYREIGKALKQEKESENMTEVDEDKIMRMTEVLQRKVYGEYNEFED